MDKPDDLASLREGEPVGELVDVGDDTHTLICEWTELRYKLPAGTKLYARPPAAPPKWCSYCRNDTHNDAECGCTRIIRTEQPDQRGQLPGPTLERLNDCEPAAQDTACRSKTSTRLGQSGSLPTLADELEQIVIGPWTFQEGYKEAMLLISPNEEKTIKRAADALRRTEAADELLEEACGMLKHTRCNDDDAMRCPACSLEARIGLYFNAKGKQT